MASVTPEAANAFAALRLAIEGYGQETLLDDSPAWMSDAACAGLNPDQFFPTRGEHVDQAKAVCAGCPVRQACHDYAVANGEKFGIWGGVSENERRRARREARRARA
jgi:WhiB family redox-sensing transcriptional regulator